MKIYTKTGDRGETSLVSGTRVLKTHPRLEAYGTLDELNSFIGLLRCEVGASVSADASAVGAVQKNLEMIQNNLFNIGSHLACDDATMATKLPGLSDGSISALETDMDQWESTLPALKNFILPGGVRSAGLAHVARCVCRRAERAMVGIDGVVNEHLIFVNRLSDWLFMLSRYLNASAGVGDVPWRKG